jgi:hypothetical protein
LARQLGVDMRGGDAHLLGHWHQVADLAQKAGVAAHVDDRAGIGLVPGVEPRLQAVALGQQRRVLGPQVVNDGVETVPETGAVEVDCRQHLLLDELVQGGCHLQAVDCDAVCHGD